MHKILVIDDDLSVRQLVVQMLVSKGYQVVSAEDGRRGLALFRDEKPDLIVTDIIMPEKGGIATIRNIRSECPDAKIIAMSGDGRIGNANLLDIARWLGASDVIAKPFDPDQFITVVRNRLAAA